MITPFYRRTVLTVSQSPVVSVIVYIRQNDPVFLERSLVSILSQQTNFLFEIIVLSDARATESVEDIGREYAATYPDKISFYPYPRRIGYIPFFSYDITVNSPYAVLCSDKEIWTDAGKLQKQYDFLQANPSYTVCLHRTGFLYEDGCLSEGSYDLFGKRAVFSVGDLSQLLVGRSAMFRLKRCPYRAHFMLYQKEGISLFTEQVVSGRLKMLSETVSDVLLNSGEQIKDMNRRVKIYLF